MFLMLFKNLLITLITIFCMSLLFKEERRKVKDGMLHSESLMSDIIKLTKAEITDINDIFEWRNHPDIRKNFFNQELLSWDEHEKWFIAKLNDPDAAAYMAYYKKEKIGTIRFEAAEAFKTIRIRT